MEMALADRSCGGVVIAQDRRVAAKGSIRAHDVHVPGVLVDHVVETPGMLQTTATPCDPATSGEIIRPLDGFSMLDFGIQKVIARRVAQELRKAWIVNIAFGVPANVPRVFLEEGHHGSVFRVIERGAVGGIP